MTPRYTLVVVFLWCLCSRIDGIRGRSWDDLELEKQLKQINKPAVQIIQTIHGDTYGCVNFYQQPAFDHPALKDHKFEYKMAESEIYEDLSNPLHPKNIWLNDEGCPNGTVPIKRTTKDDLIRIKQATEIYNSNSSHLSNNQPGVHYAVADTKGNPYNGASMITSLYNPQVQAPQFSGTRMVIENGVENMHVGWIIHPNLYKDTRTRLFIFTKTKTSKCYNTYCPGFIALSQRIPVDLVYSPTSVRGGNIYETQFYIYKDKTNGDWFVEVGNKNEKVGTWPSRIFGDLAKIGSYVEWGGFVYSPPTMPSPPMGSGASRIFEDTRQDAYCSNIRIVNENHQLIDASNLNTYPDIYPFYDVKNEGNVGGEFQTLVFYGGPGGYKGN